VATLNNLRRFYLHKRLWASQLDDDWQRIWQGKQEAIPGTALAATFPHKTTLAACGYTTTEDLTGADEAELIRVGFTPLQAEQILAAL
jgi:hypothetical protein